MEKIGLNLFLYKNHVKSKRGNNRRAWTIFYRKGKLKNNIITIDSRKEFLKKKTFVYFRGYSFNHSYLDLRVTKGEVGLKKGNCLPLTLTGVYLLRDRGGPACLACTELHAFLLGPHSFLRRQGSGWKRASRRIGAGFLSATLGKAGSP